MGIINKIKRDVKRSGSNKSKFFYVRDGDKVRIRFLNDIDEGMEVVFHDSFEEGINVPCQETFGKSCEYCDQEGLRTRSQYVWSVWDYEANEVKLFMFPVNNFTPIPNIMAFFETYGIITDRDYVIGLTGKGVNKSYSVVPMDKVKFRNSKAKPYSEKKILGIINKAYPDENAEDDFEEEPRTRNKATRKRKPVEDDYDDSDWEDEESNDIDYSEMKAVELYKLCKEREIEAEPRKNKKLYINLLEEYDQAQEDWSEDEDEWEDEWEDWEDE